MPPQCTEPSTAVLQVSLVNSRSLMVETADGKKIKGVDESMSRLGWDQRTDGQGMTAVVWAAKVGLFDAVQALLDAGATAHIEEALDTALEHHNEECARVIIRHRQCHWLEMVEQGLQAGAGESTHSGVASRVKHVSGRLPSRDRDRRKRLKRLRDKELLDAVADLVAQHTDPTLVPRQVVRVATARGIRQALLVCMQVVDRVKQRIRSIREHDPARNDHADDLEMLSYQLQLCAAAVLTLQCSDDNDLASTLREDAGRKAFDLALSMEAKIFLSQPTVVAYVRRTWTGGKLGSKLITYSCEGVRERLAQTLALLLQLPLLLAVAIYPPLEQLLQRAWPRMYFLSVPAVKFSISFVCDGLFTAILTFAPRWVFATAWASEALLVWALASVMWEMQQAVLFDCASSGWSWARYAADRFNRVDLSSALMACATLISIMLDHAARENVAAAGDVTTIEALVFELPAFSPHTRSLRAISVLLLWLRVPRLFFLSSRHGPLVLMLFRMVNDTAEFLILLCSVLVSFSAAFLVLFEPSESLHMWPWNTSLVNVDNRDDCVARFSAYGSTLEFLVEAALTGSEFFSCGLTTDTPALAWFLTIVFYSITGLLLLNMLIAMMAKTFDQVFDASAVNVRQLLFRNTVRTPRHDLYLSDLLPCLALSFHSPEVRIHLPPRSSSSC